MAEKWSGMRNNFDVLIKQATEEYSNFIIIPDRVLGQIETYVPSVFPHDLYPPMTKSLPTETMFKQLCLIEEGFQQKREKYTNLGGVLICLNQ